jgi:PKD repeat protein
MDKPELRKMLRLHFSNFKDIDNIVELVKKLDIVEYAEKIPIYKTTYTPNDTYYSGTDKWYHDLVGSSFAWDISLGRPQIKIAIVDNAVFCGHLDLTTFKQRDVADNDNDATPPKDYNTDPEWSHGTHCAGLATANTNNSRGIASLGAGVQLIGVKCTPDNATNSSSVVYTYDGVLWACQNGAHIVSMSFAGLPNSQAFQDLINAYPNVVFFAGAGNDNSSTPVYPAAFNNVICVGAVEPDDTRYSYSNYNGSTTWVDISSPGGWNTYGGLLSTVYTTDKNGYAKMGGTSMATPFAAGLAGLMLSLNPSLTPAQILNCLVTTGKNINQNIGPRINAQAAMQCVQSMLTGDPIANFYADKTDIYVKDSVLFTDNSVGGGNPITSWQWTFSGGTPSTYNGQTPPKICYSSVGNYNVTLTVTNSKSSKSTTKTAYIKVSAIPYGQWILENTGFSNAGRGIKNISIVNQNVVWAIAYDGTSAKKTIQEFTKTTNGGITWTPGTISILDTTKVKIGMLAAGDANTAWVAVTKRSTSGSNGIWKTTNGGTTWSQQTTATFSNASSFPDVIHFWGLDTGFCMGDPINGEFEIYTTINGGTTWTLLPGANIPNPLTGESSYNAIGGFEVVKNNVWFTTNKGRIYYSSDKGKTFAAYQTPISDFGNPSGVNGRISFKDATNGILTDNTGKVWKTANAGATWTAVTTTGKVFATGLCWVETTDLIFSTGSSTTVGASGSSYSLDDGVTWVTIDTSEHTCVDFINTAIGWSGFFNTSASAGGMWKWRNMQNPMVPNFTASNTNICKGASVTFTDQTTGTTPTKWTWTFTGGTPATSTVQNPSITYNSAGTYDVTLVTTDVSGATATKTRIGYVTVSVPPATPGTITGLPNPCIGKIETYFVPSVSNNTYNWTLPATWTGTSSTNSINATVGTGSGNISVTATNVCGTSTAITFSVTPTTVPAAVASFTSSVTADSVKFTSTSTNATSWLWNFGDGFTSSLQNPTHHYAANGTYTVTLTATNKCGNNSITKTIVITSVGINSVASSPLKVYPNPASSKLFIELGSATSNYKGEILVTDVTGRVVNTSQVDGDHFSINISMLENGMYFLVLKNTNIVFRFLKE